MSGAAARLIEAAVEHGIDSGLSPAQMAVAMVWTAGRMLQAVGFSIEGEGINPVLRGLMDGYRDDEGERH